MAAAAPTTSDGKLNFLTLLETFAYVSYLKSKKQTKNVQKFLVKGTSKEFKDFVFEISWDRTTLDLENAEWDLQSCIVKSEKQIFGTWEYDGGTANIEVKHERKGKSTATFSLTWTEGNTFGLGMKPSISLPVEVAKLFGVSTVLDINGDSFQTTQDQEWSFSVNVPVPKDCPTKVDTVVKEVTYMGSLSCEAYLDGRVSVQIFKKNGHKYVTTVTDNVVEVLKKLNTDLRLARLKRKGRSSELAVAKNLEAFIQLPEQNQTMRWKISADCHVTMGTNGVVKVDRAESVNK